MVGFVVAWVESCPHPVGLYVGWGHSYMSCLEVVCGKAVLVVRREVVFYVLTGKCVKQLCVLLCLFPRVVAYGYVAGVFGVCDSNRVRMLTFGKTQCVFEVLDD